MIKTRIIDEIFDTGSCQNYILSIQCSLNGFSFLIFDTISKRFIAHLEHELILATPFELKSELEKLFKTEAILSIPFNRVVISYLSLRSVLVPTMMDADNEFNVIFDTIFEKTNDEINLENEVIPGFSKITFQVPGIIYRYLKDKYPISNFIAPPLPIIKYGFSNIKNGTTIFIARFHDLLILLCIAENKIHFMNQFYVKNETDCLFYILSMSKQLSLDSKTAIILIGKIHPHGVLFSSLRNYFELVEFGKEDERCIQSLMTNSGQEHYLIPQFEQTLCE